ncbi:MAG: TetR/AcrR family transcriptional regulator [Rhodanobacter sp.]
MKSSIDHLVKKAGRPLSFDREAALHQAMLLFWQHGYEATSLTALTHAMGVTAPSIYTAFVDKKHLFLEAVDRYVSGPVTSAGIIDNAATARDAAFELLKASAIGFTGSSTPAGCLLASSAISCSPAASDIQAELAAIRRRIESQLRQRIRQAMHSGEMPHDVDATGLAAYTMAVIQGMSTLARDGATRSKLMRVVTMAMSAWPA